ncbi:MAG: ABC transporter ATP-binding protein [Thermotogaceae bacterium]|nr:ABC transporter ATP-binding protein [Thermotogaceae bacterium]
MKIVEVKNLKKYYKDVKAVDGISFNVEEGSIFALLGPNGAGKTTTVEILEGLRKKDSGEIKLFGETVDDIPKEMKKRIGVQLQKSAFFSHLTVRETLSLFRELYGRGYRVREILEMVHLVDKEKSLVKNLSGGQLQRLALGVALINDPELIFLDEPTTGLDPQARRMVWGIIKDLKSKGKTIFLTTHYMEEAEYLADVVCIIDHGKIVEMGGPEEIIRRSGLKTVIEMETIEDFVVKGAEKLDANKYRLIVNEPERVLPEILKSGKVSNVMIRKPNLEDVFLKLTGHSLRD